MKITKKKPISAAAILTAAGMITALASLIFLDFDYTRLNTASFTTNTYPVNMPFDSISCKGADYDVFLLPSEDDSCRVECTESGKITHSVNVKNNTLNISRQDGRKWYEHINFGIYWGSLKITVYLPKTEYRSLYILNSSGNIDVPKDFSFENAEIRCTSGDVRFLSSASADLSVRNTSGHINLSDLKCRNISAQSISGDITFSDISARESVNIQSTSGTVSFSNASASKDIRIQSTSGDVKLLGCDAQTLWIKTTSGEVYGTLLTDKTFITDTKSGTVSVPASSSGGRCEITTTSGDIRFYIE